MPAAEHLLATVAQRAADHPAPGAKAASTIVSAGADQRQMPMCVSLPITTRSVPSGARHTSTVAGSGSRCRGDRLRPAATLRRPRVHRIGLGTNRLGTPADNITFLGRRRPRPRLHRRRPASTRAPVRRRSAPAFRRRARATMIARTSSFLTENNPDKPGQARTTSSACDRRSTSTTCTTCTAARRSSRRSPCCASSTPTDPPRRPVRGDDQGDRPGRRSCRSPHPDVQPRRDEHDEVVELVRAPGSCTCRSSRCGWRRPAR